MRKNLNIVSDDFHPLERRKFLCLRELAELYNLKYSTLQKWASQRRFPCYKLGGRIRVKRKEFEAWLEKHHIKGEIS